MDVIGYESLNGRPYSYALLYSKNLTSAVHDNSLFNFPGKIIVLIGSNACNDNWCFLQLKRDSSQICENSMFSKAIRGERKCLSVHGFCYTLSVIDNLNTTNSTKTDYGSICGDIEPSTLSYDIVTDSIYYVLGRGTQWTLVRKSLQNPSMADMIIPIPNVNETLMQQVLFFFFLIFIKIRRLVSTVL